MKLGWANITPKKNFLGQRKQTSSFEGMGRIHFNMAEFFGPSGRKPFRGPGNTIKRHLEKRGWKEFDLGR